MPLTTCALLASIGEVRLDPTHAAISWKFNTGLFPSNWVNKCHISSLNSSIGEVISLACFCFRLLISSVFFKELVVTDLPHLLSQSGCSSQDRSQNVPSVVSKEFSKLCSSSCWIKLASVLNCYTISLPIKW